MTGDLTTFVQLLLIQMNCIPVWVHRLKKCNKKTYVIFLSLKSLWSHNVSTENRFSAVYWCDWCATFLPEYSKIHDLICY